MLDKSIPYRNLMMACEKREENKESLNVPQGFVLRGFLPGDEKAWAKIETAVLEFDREEQALEYFKKEYGPYPKELESRCFLLFTDEGEPVATASAWFEQIEGYTYSKVHWVAVVPKFQGQGLGKLVMNKVLEAFDILPGSNWIFLHTQTWSHKAVCLYHQLGFSLIKNQTPDNEDSIPPFYRDKKNDYERALPILQQVLGSERTAVLEATAL